MRLVVQRVDEGGGGRARRQVRDGGGNGLVGLRLRDVRTGSIGQCPAGVGLQGSGHVLVGAGEREGEGAALAVTRGGAGEREMGGGTLAVTREEGEERASGGDEGEEGQWRGRVGRD